MIVLFLEKKFRQPFNFDSKRTKMSPANLQADAISATKDLIDAVTLMYPMDVHNYDIDVRISFSAYNQIRNYFVLARSTSFQVEMLSTEMSALFQFFKVLLALMCYRCIYQVFLITRCIIALRHSWSFFFFLKTYFFSPLNLCTLLLCFYFFFFYFI